MKIKSFIIENINLFVYLILSIFAVLPLLSNGFFSMHDDTQVARVFEMGKSLSSGMFPVRWVEDLGYGFGYPIFNFYSVLPYYIGGFLTVGGVDSLIATKIVFVLGIILSGVSMFYFVKGFFGKNAALVASIVYLYFPYHAVNIYVRGDLAELTAYIFLPLIFLGLYKIGSSDAKTNLKLYTIISSISLGALIISHNLSAFMMFIFIFLFMIVSLVYNKNKRALFVSFSLVLVLGFLLSAFYSIPAVVEMKYTNVLSVVGGGSDYRDHFVCLNQFWDSQWGFGGSAPGCLDGVSFKLGKLNIVLTLLAFGVFILNFKKLKEKRFILVTSFAFLLFSIFMTLNISAIIWSIPYMDFLQFPWRFINFIGLFISFVTGYLIWQVEFKFKKRAAIGLSLLIIIVTIFMNAKLFVPQSILPVESNYYTNVKYLRWGVSKISDEYLPKGFVSPTEEGKVKFPSLQNNSLFVKVEDGDSFHFDTKETLIERLADFLTIVGVIALIAVIISKLNIFYGKKTS